MGIDASGMISRIASAVETAFYAVFGVRETAQSAVSTMVAV